MSNKRIKAYVPTVVTATVMLGSTVVANASGVMGIGNTTDNLNMRRGASTSYSKIITIPKGKEVKIISEKTSTGWVKVSYAGYEGWCSSRYIKEKSTVVKYVSGIRRLELREKATSAGKVYGYIYEGEKVNVIDYNGSYARVKYNNRIYYILKSKLVSTNPSKTMYVFGAWRKTLYDGPGSSYNKKGYIYEGESATVVGKQGDYLHVIYKGKRYYMYDLDLVSTNPSTYKYVTGNEKIPVTYGGETIQGYLVEGQKIKVFGTEGGNTRISFNGRTGYIKAGDRLKNYEVNQVVRVPYVNVCSQKSATSTKLGKIYNGAKVNIYAIEGLWAKIQYNGQWGYISVHHIEDAKYLSQDVALRSSMSNSASIVYRGKEDEEVWVESYSNGWAKVSVNDEVIGYVENKYLKTVKEDEGSQGELMYLQTLNVNDASVNKRYSKEEGIKVFKTSQGESSGVYGLLRKNAQVEKIKSEGDYCQIKVNDSISGWVEESSLSHRDMVAKNSESVVSKKLSTSHSQYVDTQVGKPYVSIEDVEYYSNPLNYSMSNGDHKYQFLKLDSYRRINAYELNEYLNSLSVSNGNLAIFKDQASAFISAAKKYNIDPIYLVAHTMLETGYGSSKLAQGIVVTEDLAGNPIEPVKVHNLFGIGAIDSDAIGAGSKTAYSLGWTSIPKAIEGAVRWISLGVEANPQTGLKKSDGYIHSVKHTHQYTLYSMRWDYVSAWHQYATDPQWSLKISRLMNRLSYLYEGANLVFENIVYAPETIVKLYGESSEMKVIKETSVKSGPSDDFREIGVLQEGDIVKIIGESEDLYVIDYNGAIGYVSKEKVEENIEENVDVEYESDVQLNEEEKGTDTNIESDVQLNEEVNFS